MKSLSGILMFSLLSGFQTVTADETEYDPYDTSETIESPVIIQGNEPIESVRTQNGDVRYRVQFFGRDYCVRVTEPNPLDSFDTGATYWIPCY